MKKIEKMSDKPLAGTSNSAHEDIWELRTKLNEIIGLLNKVVDIIVSFRGF